MPRYYITVENVATVPSEQSVRAPRGGTREKKDSSEPCLSRGVVE